MKIRSGRGIIIYSAGQGLRILYNSKFTLMETSLETNANIATRVHCTFLLKTSHIIHTQHSDCTVVVDADDDDMVFYIPFNII